MYVLVPRMQLSWVYVTPSKETMDLKTRLFKSASQIDVEKCRRLEDSEAARLRAIDPTIHVAGSSRPKRMHVLKRVSRRLTKSSLWLSSASRTAFIQILFSPTQSTKKQ